MKNKFKCLTVCVGMILTILWVPMMQSSVYAEDSEVTYEQAKNAAEEVLAESQDYIVNFLTTMGENIPTEDFSVGELCLYVGLQIELPSSVKECEPNGAIFEVNAGDKTIALMSIVKRNGVYSRSTIMGSELAQEFITAKSNVESIAEEYIVLSSGKDRYFYAVVNGEEMIYPTNYNTFETDSYMRSAKTDSLSIYKQDFQQMLYQMKADSDSGLMGGSLMSYLPEQASANQSGSLLSIAMMISGSVIALVGVVFIVRICKKRKNNDEK